MDGKSRYKANFKHKNVKTVLGFYVNEQKIFSSHFLGAATAWNATKCNINELK